MQCVELFSGQLFVFLLVLCSLVDPLSKLFELLNCFGQTVEFQSWSVVRFSLPGYPPYFILVAIMF